MWWLYTALGMILCGLVVLIFIIAVVKAETGETWYQCTKRFLKGFFKGRIE